MSHAALPNEPDDDLPDVLHEVASLLSAAHEVMQGETRADVNAEVTDTVRYDQAHVSWLERLAVAPQDVGMTFDHPELELVPMHVTHACDTSIIATHGHYEYFINPSYVTSISGLSSLSRTHQPMRHKCRIAWLNQCMDFDDELDVFIRPRLTIRGRIAVINRDSIDVLTRRAATTVPTEGCVAIRRSCDGLS